MNQIQADLSVEPTVAQEESTMDSVVAGHIMLVVESNLFGSPDESGDSSISLSTKFSLDSTIAKKIEQASPVLKSRKADNAFVEIEENKARLLLHFLRIAGKLRCGVAMVKSTTVGQMDKPTEGCG
ncbi:hypothetical protein AXG93_1615s1120 [Marchantia polymorpha subsp. ruderalis]|uniref:Uncharacterized protein n=1 Tax=Marchantia polymorpha subsp. ruderalis TaxID=1480154 RepID=A0A176VUI3_MARPO|nr:hypothetical protein AXG93_1615s1120 [Marchantia polymorpha subsp. ruderalis]